ncbi:hypothetical protein HanOQP8_Chr02g0050641 [Helianthus annuus]|nr:hypothetical protein HanOQP8_Chr02g0050641 [Helianthus annuus]
MATPLGARLPATAKPELGKSPARDGAILLLSKESTGSSNGLIHRSTCAGPCMRPVRASRGDVASKPSTAEPKAVTVRFEQEEPEKKTQPEAQTRKHSSRPKSLDYVVVSDTLSGLDVGMKRAVAEDEDDQATITQIMEKKRKLLADEKRELDAYAALKLSGRKRKMMGQVVAPSESEVDLGVFAKKPGNILGGLYEESSKRKGIILYQLFTECIFLSLFLTEYNECKFCFVLCCPFEV